ncbi:MAG: hypothetical protein AB1414_17090 [bacterium]
MSSVFLPVTIHEGHEMEFSKRSGGVTKGDVEIKEIGRLLLKKLKLILDVQVF